MIKQNRNVTVMITALLLVLALVQSSWGGGSFSRDDLIPILEQQPAIAALVAGGLDLDESGSANRIGRNVNPNLGGLRVGPYTILAKPKGAPGPFTLEVTVDTDQDFQDDNGKSVELEKAAKVVEKLISITIRPASE